MFDIEDDVSQQPAVLCSIERQRDREWATVIDTLELGHMMACQSRIKQALERELDNQ